MTVRRSVMQNVHSVEIDKKFSACYGLFFFKFVVSWFLELRLIVMSIPLNPIPSVMIKLRA